MINENEKNEQTTKTMQEMRTDVLGNILYGMLPAKETFNSI